MVPKDMLSFPQVTAKPDFYIIFRYVICVVTVMISRPPHPSPANKSTAHRPSSLRVRVQCKQIQIPKVGADRNEEIIPANRLTQTTCRHYTHLH